MLALTKLRKVVLVFACALGLTAPVVGQQIEVQQGPEPLSQVTEVSPMWHGVLVSGSAGIGLSGGVQALGREVSGKALTGTVALDYVRQLGALLVRPGIEVLGVERTVRVGDEPQLRSRSLRVGATSLLGLHLGPSTAVFAGAQVRTQRDVAEFDIREQGNVRWDLRLVGSYQLQNRLALEATLARGVARSSAVAYVHDPRTQLRLGVAYKLWP